MNSNKNFVASLIAVVGAFMLLPLAAYYCNLFIERVKYEVTFLYVMCFAVAIIAVAVFVVETIYAIKANKENGNGKVYNLVSIILNGLLAVVAIVAFIVAMVERGKMGGLAFDEFFLAAGPTILPFLFVAATSGVACGFKLFNLLKK